MLHLLRKKAAQAIIPVREVIKSWIPTTDQHEVHQVAGELEQETFGRIVLPGSQPTIGKPHAVFAVAEAKLDGGSLLADAPEIAERCTRRFGSLSVGVFVDRLRTGAIPI